MYCFFVSDLHGKEHLYRKLKRQILRDSPDVVFMGGDLLPHGYISGDPDKHNFIDDFLLPEFAEMKEEMGNDYPIILVILGNDDPRVNELRIKQIEEEQNLWYYLHNRKMKIGGYTVYGYSFIPPSPFGLKDWEKYDVSRFVDPGCTHPYQGMRTVDPDFDTEYSNIKNDLDELVTEEDLSQSVFLFHAPPYQTPLDRAALDGKTVDYVPLDVHVGSIAIQRFIQECQPLLTLHGHVHEAYSITGQWKTHIGSTSSFNAAYDDNQLAVISFRLSDLEKARHQLI